MKALKTKLSGRTTLILLAVNWITLIVLTVWFLGEETEMSYKIVGTLLVGFFLQMKFLCDQLKKRTE
ncbi:MAG: hypothetical protein R2780_11970 [Crocinitomicaceae bacterium]|nr:hypothetical protein [Crocinitomicaceae bacterium]